MTTEIFGNQGRPSSKTCLGCSRKSVYPEKMFGDWFYPREQICFDCLMIGCSRYDQIRPRKPPSKMSDKAELLFPLTVVDTSNNNKIGNIITKKTYSLQLINTNKKENQEPRLS
jgi:hypothetical protein